MYLNNFCCISPLGLLHACSDFPPVEKKDDHSAFCIEPDYTSWISPMQLRRMSRLLRMSITAAKVCLEKQPLPEAIHVGTAYGMLEESELFLQKMIDQEEALLTPTAFIQSTHNTIAGQIALALDTNVHNMTFVHKGHSFESALVDAALILKDREEGQVLAGAADVLTNMSFEILKRAGIYVPGVVAGEGVAFFSISQNKKEASIAELSDFSFFKANNKAAAFEQMEHFIKAHADAIGPEDLFLNGATGTANSKAFYEDIKTRFFPAQSAIAFKDLCGEYPTASSFGLAYATWYLKNNPGRNCWLINNFGRYWSLFLIKGMNSSV